MAVDQHLQPGEEVLYRAHPSRIPLIPPLAGVVLALLAGVVMLRFVVPPGHDGAVGIGVGLLVLVLLAVAGMRYLRLISREYILTNQRLLQQQGLLSKRSIDSYLSKINNIEYSQTFWGRLLGVGDLKIDTANADEPSIFPAIADPLGFKRAIAAAVEAYLASGARPAMAATAAAAPSGAERLRQLKGLLDDGLITQAEFDAKRKQLLDDI
ncbi:MAG TPA: PH domain-containing protein [Thermoanaerobaculia bacterium]|nr:PH domain-containing protein [Thermoanaerobaculia bacterium]